MPSVRETAVLALVAALETTKAKVSRDTDVPKVVPPEGWIFAVEGDANIETILSPLSYGVEQIIEIDAHVTGPDESARDTAMDDLLQAISTALTADRTLGGAVEFLDIGQPDFQVFLGDGKAKSVRLPVTLFFTTIASPLT